MDKTYCELEYLKTAPGPGRVEIRLQAGGTITLSRGEDIKTWLGDADRVSLTGRRPPWFKAAETKPPESEIGTAKTETQHRAARAARKMKR